jgi:hypothetical protein
MSEKENKPSAPTEVMKPASKKVKVLTLRPVMINAKEGNLGAVEGTIVPENTRIEVTEEEAKMLCDQDFKGHYKFSGQRYDSEASEMHNYRRAIRINE